MKKLPVSLQQKLDNRKAKNALRKLGISNNLVDFSSNDYLGFSKSKVIFDASHHYLLENNIKENGATGSRLLSGNHKLYDVVETRLCKAHNCEAALIFNSGYDANLGFFSCVPQRNDIILYDEFSHASIRDGIQLSNAKAYKFKHNDLIALEGLLKRFQNETSEIYVVTESVFSMDGDTPDIEAIVALCKTHKVHLIVDEAHSVGVLGEKGYGQIQELGLENDVFARIITFGKALGIHGAAVLGSDNLKTYLTNFARSFIYTTALPPHTLATINCAYNSLVIQSESEESQLKKLHQNIQFFKSKIEQLHLQDKFINSDSAIHCCIIPGNEKVKYIASQFQKNGFNVKPILSPTVAEGQERLRFCLHSYNSKEEITKVLQLLATFV